MLWYNERINTSADEKKQSDCLQDRPFLFVYESVTNTEKPQVLRYVFMRLDYKNQKNLSNDREKEWKWNRMKRREH
jgi:hypothetical protein